MNQHLPHTRPRVTEEPITPGRVYRASRTFCRTVIAPIPGCPSSKTVIDKGCPCQGTHTSPCACARKRGD